MGDAAAAAGAAAELAALKYKFVVSDLPAGNETYDLCRHGITSAADANCFATDAQVETYLTESGDASIEIEDLKPGKQLYRAIVNSTPDAKSGVATKEIVSMNVRGCGRVAVRVADKHYLFTQAKLASKASSQIVLRKCETMAKAEEFMASFRLDRTHLGTGEDKLSPSMGISLLQVKIGELPEIAPAIAALNARGETSLDKFVEAFDNAISEWKAKQDKRKSGFAGSAKQSDNPAFGKKCGYFHNMNHVEKDCRKQKADQAAAAASGKNAQRKLWTTRRKEP